MNPELALTSTETPNRNFQYRSKELVRAVNRVNAIVKQTLNGAKLKHKLLIAPFLPRYWYQHCNRPTCRSPVYKVHYLEGLENSLRLSTGDFKLLSIKSLYNFLCKIPNSEPKYVWTGKGNWITLLWSPMPVSGWSCLSFWAMIRFIWRQSIGLYMRGI